MKLPLLLKKAAFVLMLLISVVVVQGQKLIQPADITPELLKNICEDAAITVQETKDTYVKVKETFVIYLDIDKEKRFIYVNTSYPLVPGTTAEKALALMNKLNKEIILLKCYYNAEKNIIYYGYDFWTENGFTNRTLVNVIKMFSKAISLSLEKDTEKLIK